MFCGEHVEDVGETGNVGEICDSERNGVGNNGVNSNGVDNNGIGITGVGSVGITGLGITGGVGITGVTGITGVGNNGVFCINLDLTIVGLSAVFDSAKYSFLKLEVSALSK